MKKQTYTAVYVMARFRGCMLERAFPWEVRNATEIVDSQAVKIEKKALQYGKSREGCIDWIEAQGAEYVAAKMEVISL